MYTTAKKLLSHCELNQCAIWEVALESTEMDEKMDAAAIYQDLLHIYEVMKAACERGQKEPLSSITGLLHGNAYQLMQERQHQALLPPELLDAMSMALSTSEVNAAMGRIVASPTAGAAGILPACLRYWQKLHHADDETTIRGLLTASHVGAIIMARANVSGAEGGCQAETGSASAMAAAALVELSGGTPEQALQAASYALIHVMGLVCDPIGGRVEYPCLLRNANGVLNALGSAEMALHDLQTFHDFDQVVMAMKEVGDALPASLRETGLGGIAKQCATCGLGSTPHCVAHSN